MPFEVIADFNYPGHSAHRMHGLPSRTGLELIDRLRGAGLSFRSDLVVGSGGRQILLGDPSGNLIELFQYA